MQNITHNITSMRILTNTIAEAIEDRDPDMLDACADAAMDMPITEAERASQFNLIRVARDILRSEEEYYSRIEQQKRMGA